MPARELQTAGLIMATADSGERHRRLHILSPTEGRVVALWRRSSKQSGGGPDLFDQAHFQLESSSRSSTWFLREYRLECRREGLARRYRSFQLAARLADLLWRNLPHSEYFEPAARLADEALDAFADSPLPRCVYLKALYRYALEEGYAVRQQWLASLSTREQERTRAILREPLNALADADDQDAEAIIDRLERWLRADTDILVP